MTPGRARSLLSGTAGVVLLYAALSLLAFPFPETLAAGTDARHHAFDIFDDGTVSRLGGLREDWLRYGWTWWNEHLTNGNAYFAQFVATPLALDSFLALGLGPFGAYTLRLYLTVLAAGLSLHFFLRRSIGLPSLAALVGSLVYLMGFWHYGYGFTVALAPFVLWISDEAAGAPPSRRRWLRVAEAFLCAFLFYNVSSQAAVFLALLHLAWVLLTTSPGAPRRSGLMFWAVAWAIGLALYAPVLLPQIAALPDSVRAIRSDAEQIASLGVILKGFLSLYLPVLLGTPAVAGLGVPPELPERGTWYAGAAAVGLLLWSFFQPRESRRERALLLLLAAVPAFDLLVRPIWIVLQEHLGVLRSLQPRRLNLYVPFLLAANLGVAVAITLRSDRARDGGGLLPRRLSWALAAVGAVQALLAARVLLYLLRRHGGSMWELPALPWAAAVAYAGFGAATLLLLARRERPPDASPTLSGTTWSTRAALVLFLVFALDRIAYARIERHMRPGDLASFREVLGETPAIRFLREQGKESGRVLTLGDHSFPNRVDHPNRIMFWGLRASDGYQNIYPLQYHRLFGELIAPFLSRNESRRRYYQSWGQRAYLFGPEFNRAIASLLGVRWLYVRGVEIDRTGLGTAFQQGEETVYENREALPRAFLAGGTRIWPSQSALFDALSRASLREMRDAVFLARPDAGALSERPNHSVGGDVRLYESSPDRFRLEVSSPDSAWLVVSDAYDRSWEAAVNGSTTPILPAYGALRAVPVPAGQSRVEFRYRPRDEMRGAAIAAAATAVLLAATLASRSSSTTGAPA